MSIARVRERGQITLPLAVRVAMGASTGSDLLFVPSGAGLFTVRRLERPELLLDLLEQFAGDGPAPDLGGVRPGTDDAFEAPFAPEEAP
jgi:bifunctional DNA-binding transcriptional regulator/antitoxin component of YhaV-PrlF toxin-antitoxin module